MRKRSETAIAAVDGESVRQRLLAIEKQLNGVFVNRENVIRVMIVAHLIRQHYLLVGTPGTAKTAIATAFAKHIKEASYFKTMLGSFSSPEKVFGPLDIERFKEGKYEYVTDGRLADVEFAFLDEFFKANEATLNELLTALNEREFHGEKIPLQTCGMATNWPEVLSRTDNTNALYDRCLLRVEVADVESIDDMMKVLEAVDSVESYVPDSDATITLAELEHAQAEVDRVGMLPEIRRIMASTRQKLATRNVAGQTKPGVTISSRRLGALQRAMRAVAWLDGRNQVSIADFDILRYGLWNDRGDQELVRSTLDTLDLEEVQKVVAKIDAARSEYQRLVDADFGTVRVTQVTELFAETVSYVKDMASKPIFTRNGEAAIKKAMAKLVKDFKDMNSRETNFVNAMSKKEG